MNKKKFLVGLGIVLGLVALVALILFLLTKKKQSTADVYGSSPTVYAVSNSVYTNPANVANNVPMGRDVREKRDLSPTEVEKLITTQGNGLYDLEYAQAAQFNDIRTQKVNKNVNSVNNFNTIPLDGATIPSSSMAINAGAETSSAKSLSTDRSNNVTPIDDAGAMQLCLLAIQKIKDDKITDINTVAKELESITGFASLENSIKLAIAQDVVNQIKAGTANAESICKNILDAINNAGSASYSQAFAQCLIIVGQINSQNIKDVTKIVNMLQGISGFSLLPGAVQTSFAQRIAAEVPNAKSVAVCSDILNALKELYSQSEIYKQCLTIMDDIYNSYSGVGSADLYNFISKKLLQLSGFSLVSPSVQSSLINGVISDLKDGGVFYKENHCVDIVSAISDAVKNSEVFKNCLVVLNKIYDDGIRNVEGIKSYLVDNLDGFVMLSGATQTVLSQNILDDLTDGDPYFNVGVHCTDIAAKILEALNSSEIYRQCLVALGGVKSAAANYVNDKSALITKLDDGISGFKLLDDSVVNAIVSDIQADLTLYIAGTADFNIQKHCAAITSEIAKKIESSEAFKTCMVKMDAIETDYKQNSTITTARIAQILSEMSGFNLISESVRMGIVSKIKNELDINGQIVNKTTYCIDIVALISDLKNNDSGIKQSCVAVLGDVVSTQSVKIMAMSGSERGKYLNDFFGQKMNSFVSLTSSFQNGLVNDAITLMAQNKTGASDVLAVCSKYFDYSDKNTTGTGSSANNQSSSSGNSGSSNNAGNNSGSSNNAGNNSGSSNNAGNNSGSSSNAGNNSNSSGDNSSNNSGNNSSGSNNTPATNSSSGNTKAPTGATSSTCNSIVSGLLIGLKSSSTISSSYVWSQMSNVVSFAKLTTVNQEVIVNEILTSYNSITASTVCDDIMKLLNAIDNDGSDYSSITTSAAEREMCAEIQEKISAKLANYLAYPCPNFTTECNSASKTSYESSIIDEINDSITSLFIPKENYSNAVKVFKTILSTANATDVPKSFNLLTAELQDAIANKIFYADRYIADTIASTSAVSQSFFLDVLMNKPALSASLYSNDSRRKEFVTEAAKCSNPFRGQDYWNNVVLKLYCVEQSDECTGKFCDLTGMCTPQFCADNPQRCMQSKTDSLRLFDVKVANQIKSTTNYQKCISTILPALDGSKDETAIRSIIQNAMPQYLKVENSGARFNVAQNALCYQQKCKSGKNSYACPDFYTESNVKCDDVLAGYSCLTMAGIVQQYYVPDSSDVLTYSDIANCVPSSAEIPTALTSDYLGSMVNLINGITNLKNILGDSVLSSADTSFSTFTDDVKFNLNKLLYQYVYLLYGSASSTSISGMTIGSTNILGIVGSGVSNYSNLSFDDIFAKFKVQNGLNIDNAQDYQRAGAYSDCTYYLSALADSSTSSVTQSSISADGQLLRGYLLLGSTDASSVSTDMYNYYRLNLAVSPSKPDSTTVQSICANFVQLAYRAMYNQKLGGVINSNAINFSLLQNMKTPTGLVTNTEVEDFKGVVSIDDVVATSEIGQRLDADYQSLQNNLFINSSTTINEKSQIAQDVIDGYANFIDEVKARRRQVIFEGWNTSKRDGHVMDNATCSTLLHKVWADNTKTLASSKSVYDVYSLQSKIKKSSDFLTKNADKISYPPTDACKCIIRKTLTALNFVTDNYDNCVANRNIIINGVNTIVANSADSVCAKMIADTNTILKDSVEEVKYVGTTNVYRELGALPICITQVKDIFSVYQSLQSGYFTADDYNETTWDYTSATGFTACLSESNTY